MESQGVDVRGTRNRRCAKPGTRFCVAVFAAFWVLACSGDQGFAPARIKPNVILITWDTTRADHVGPGAAVPGLTPRWNEFAAAGAVFEVARTPVPSTLPAHSSLLTGLFPAQHDARVNGLFALDESVETLAQRLSKNGWRSGAFVSASVLASSFGLSRGFSHYDDQVSASRLRHFGERPAEATVDAALMWAGGLAADESLFLWVHLFDPHVPWQAPEPFASGYPASGYQAEIAYADQQTGRLLDGLRALGRLDDALLVLTADHGEGLGEHGEPTHGYFLYDSTIRVPLAFWAGERSGIGIPAGACLNAPVMLTDVASTIVDLLGLGAWTGDGISLRTLLMDPSTDLLPRVLPLEALEPAYILATAPVFGVVDEQAWSWFDLPRREVYDLTADPVQEHNLYEPGLQAQADALFARHRRAWPPEADPIAVSPTVVEQLESLGYLTAESSLAAEDSVPYEIGRDPKDLLPVAALWMREHIDETPAQGLREAEELAKHFGPLPILVFWRCDRLQELGRPQEAIEVLREGVEANPHSKQLRDELDRLVAQRDRDLALAGRIRSALEADPEHPAAVHDLAVVLHRLGELDAAAVLYQRWLASRPEDDETRLQYARLLGARGDLDDALEILRDGTARSGHAPTLDCQKGRLLAWWMERPAQALAPLRACRAAGLALSAGETALLGD